MDVTIKIEGLYAYLLMSNFRLYFAFLCCELPVVLTSKKRQSVDFMSGWNLKDADFLFNLENIYYFPSCSGGTISLLRSFAPSLLRSFAPSLLCSFAPSLLHSFTPSVLRFFTPSVLHSFTYSLHIRHLETGGGGWEGENSHMKRQGMLISKNLNLTPKGD